MKIPGIHSRILILILLFILFYSPGSVAQKNDFEVGLYNVGAGSIIGGVGAIINKEKEEKFLKVLLKGLGQGALGGYLVFESKRLIGKFSETGDYGYVWPSKLVHSAGASIIENAASNKPFWEKWHLNLGFNRLEFTTTDGLSVRYQIMPVALLGTIINATRGTFDPERTLKTGTFIFTAPEIGQRGSEDDFVFGQVSMFSNSILILDTWEGEYAMAHELIHVYQNDGSIGLNSFLDKPLRSFGARSSFLRTYSKLLYLDLNRIAMLGLYNLEAGQDEGYEGNVLEVEAFYFSRKDFNAPGRPELLQGNHPF